MFCCVNRNAQSLAAVSPAEQMPPIILIDFENLKRCGSFPRNPECKDITVNLEHIDHLNSLIVLISHCWLRGWSGAEGYDGSPHPDNANHEKYRLCLNGIERIHKYMAPSMKKCYVWLDFGCINQSRNPALELKQLDKIVAMSDCMFTPIVDSTVWDYRSTPAGPYADYHATAWNAEKFGYLNRGWCRTEMLYASNIPLSEIAQRKCEKFSNGLRVAYQNNRRPHYLFGTREDRLIINPTQLPPLQNSFFTEYHPSKGTVTVESDVQKIDQLVNELLPHMTFAKEAYVGDYAEISVGDSNPNENTTNSLPTETLSPETTRKVRHGRGTMTFENGEVYSGQWLNDKQHGEGMYTYADGGVYTGQWVAGEKSGCGRFDFADGSYYDGGWEKNVRSGTGTIAYADGGRYDGEWFDNKKHGKGKYVYLYGGVYDGEWIANMHHGRGHFIMPRDMTPPSDEVKQQQQKELFLVGDEYSGEWKDNLVHGEGRLTRADGTVVEGPVFENGTIVDNKMKQLDS